MSTKLAFDQLENKKLYGYELNVYNSDEYYCKRCHQVFEDLDDICEVLYTTIHMNVPKNICVCLGCADQAK